MRVEILSDHPGKLVNDAAEQRVAKQAAAEAARQAAVARVRDVRKLRAAALATGRLFRWVRLSLEVSRAKKQVLPFRSIVVPSGKEEAALAGKRAEDDVAAELGERLNDEWILFRGYRNGRGEIDQVLVGPGGVVAVEVKYVNAAVVIDGDVWVPVKVGNYGEPLDRRPLVDARGRTPSAQLNESADALASFLERFGQPVDVERVVLLTHPKARVVRHLRPTVVVGTSADAVLGCCRGRMGRRRSAEIERLVRRDHRFHERR